VVTKSVGSFDQTNPFGSSCPGDQSVTVSGHAFDIPFSRLCTPLQWFGAVLVAFSLLVAVRLCVEGV
jgi:hypothetical protein